MIKRAIQVFGFALLPFIAVAIIPSLSFAQTSITISATNSGTALETLGVGDRIPDIFIGLTDQAGSFILRSRVTWSLTDDAGGLFRISPVEDSDTSAFEVTLEVAGELDYETATEHIVTLQAEVVVSGRTLTETQALTIMVQDVLEIRIIDDAGTTNDERLLETATSGTRISNLDIEVVDETNRQIDNVIEYTLEGPSAGLFAIDGAGKIRYASTAMLNAQMTPAIEVTVVAREPILLLIARYTLTISIIDVVQTATITDSNNAVNEIFEQASVGTAISGLSLVIVDENNIAVTEGTVTWSLTDDAGGLFAINPMTGIITLTSTDPGTALYTVNVSAEVMTSRVSTPPLTTAQTFTINVYPERIGIRLRLFLEGPLQ